MLLEFHNLSTYAFNVRNKAYRERLHINGNQMSAVLKFYVSLQ